MKYKKGGQVKPMPIPDERSYLSPEEYVEQSGMACPGCGDTSFVKYSEGYEPELTGNAVTVRVECTECKATWTDEYALTGYSNLGEFDNV
jgi:pyruvate/2-oxoacid:ferredoxin oxidoreductase beta subunit